MHHRFTHTTLSRALATALALPLLALTPACTTQGTHGNDHWTQRSITNSMTL